MKANSSMERASQGPSKKPSQRLTVKFKSEVAATLAGLMRGKCPPSMRWIGLSDYKQLPNACTSCLMRLSQLEAAAGPSSTVQMLVTNSGDLPLHVECVRVTRAVPQVQS